MRLGVILGPCRCQGCGTMVTYRGDAGWCDPGSPNVGGWAAHHCAPQPSIRDALIIVKVAARASTLRAIGREFGISGARVQQIGKAFGVERRRRRLPRAV